MNSLYILNDSELLQLERPAQYLGGEPGSVTKNDSEIDLHVCLAFPDTYEVGMSHIGLQILYDLINRDKRLWAERVYSPLPDFEELLRKKGAPLTSLEAKRPLRDFDVVGFSLQYELCMNGILQILELGQIPLLAKDRDEEAPLIIGGGPVCYHPEPFAPFFDCFLIGDGEELVPEFLERVRELKSQGLNRAEQLHELRKVPGVYIPAFFEPQYSDSGQFEGFTPLYEDYTGVTRRVIASLENAPYPETPLVPNIKAVHDRLSVEVMRGCVRGCRFCQAGYLYRPQRERSPEDIIRIVENSLKRSGYEELSLLSLSTADYCSILPLLSSLKERFAGQDELAISFPSTRVDSLKPELLKEVQPVRRSGFTIAPEAGTQRLRDVISKGVTEEQLLDTCQNVFRLGWSSIKMYFMIGLPTETDEDVLGIVDLAEKVKAIAGRKRDVTVSVSTLVPKPHTPFQWAAQITQGETVRRQELLRYALRKLKVNFRYHESFSTFLEGVFARGGRELSEVILTAYKLGCRLDGWAEQLQEETWIQAFEQCGIDPYHYLHERNTAAALPWDHISCDIPKSYFLKEWERAVAARVTPDCLTQSCSICGACDYDGKKNVLFGRERSEKRLGIENPSWEPFVQLRKKGQHIGLLDTVLGETPERDNQAIPKTVHRERPGTYKLRDYLQTEQDLSENQETRSVVPVKDRYRLQYQKFGTARFIAHLDLASVFFRAGRKAAIPLAFSRGFNPKPRFSFGPPLQLGLESAAEFVDVELTQSYQPEELRDLFNEHLREGIVVTAVTPLPERSRSVQALIDYQVYCVTLRAGESNEATLQDSFVALLREDWADRIVTRKRKRKEKRVRLGDVVRDLTCFGNQCRFSLGQDENGLSLKPFEVLVELFPLEIHQVIMKKTGVHFIGESSPSRSDVESLEYSAEL